MSTAARHRQLTRLLRLERASRVIDLGCGEGLSLAAIATRLGPKGQIVGVDGMQPHVPSELAADERVQLIVADLERSLPFEDHAFDRALCHNTLECLVDREHFLAEVWRVLAPGGLFVLGHCDFDTIVFTSEDLALTRQLVHAFCDTTQKWMRTSDGTIGRDLAAIIASSRFCTEQLTAWVNLDTRFTPGSPAYEQAHALARIGQEAGVADHDAVNEWLSGLEHLASRGAFLYSINDYAVVARRGDR
jgi:SAM-dependent methyltransferase